MTRTLAIPVLCLVSAGLSAQGNWLQRGAAGRGEHAMCYDSLRGKTVVFGGSTNAPLYPFTAEWDGNAWKQQTVNPVVGTMPAGRNGPALAFDAARGNCVLFGGANGTGGYYDDTWTWDGANWANRSPATRPTGRCYHGMAYDSARQRVVLFGGQGSSGFTNDTWEWDGTSWLLRTPAGPPAARASFGLCYDSQRGRTVLFGGTGQGAVQLNDTAEWDGTTWATPNPATKPQARALTALAYDSARRVSVLLGGNTALGLAADTWEWNGVAWTPRPVLTMPDPRGYHALAFDSLRRRTVLFGGYGPFSLAKGDVWEWDGIGWAERLAHAQEPGARWGHAMAYDVARKKTVLFGGTNGSNETWTYDGSSWTQQVTGPSPTARFAHAMAYDALRQRVVLFGGGDQNVALDDTWEWDGTSWTLLAPATKPLPRHYHQLAYDAARQRTVLFGGTDSSHSTYFADTWEWDGATWTQKAPATSPGGRGIHAMAYDPGRQVIVLFGGAGPMTLADTWEWNGTTWTQQNPATKPSLRGFAAMTYDSLAARIVLFGGAVTNGALLGNFDELWEYDGTSWTLRAPFTKPAGASGHGLVGDSTRGRLVLFGGFAAGPTLLNETWEYVGGSIASVTPFGTGCPGSGGLPTLGTVPNQRPMLGATFTYEMVSLSPSNLHTAFLMIGASNTSLGPAPLPYDLTPVGMPGCWLYQSAEVTLPMGKLNDKAALYAAIPADGSMQGVLVYAQGLLIEPGVNQLGVICSNGITVKVAL